MKKIAGLLALVLAGSIAFTGCGSTKTPSGSNKDNSTDKPTKITIWFEGGDARIPYFKEVEAQMKKDYPNYSIETVTFDNSTFMTKVLQSTTATGGVDIVFNDASRILEINQKSNNGFEDLSEILAKDKNASIVLDADKKLSSSKGSLIVYPVNRSIGGLGVKTDVSGVTVDELTMPKTWDKFVSLGKAYKKAGIPGFTMHLGVDPGQVFNLIMSGSGLTDIFTTAEPKSNVETRTEIFNKIISVYAGQEAFWDKDATSEDFAAMYTKIQSGSVGMFRVGNWNAANWDKPNSGVGKYTVTTWPAIDNKSEGGLVMLNTRGLAIPKNAPNKEVAKVFLQYALTKEAQLKSFETMGSCIDLSVVDQSKLSPNQKIFFDPKVKLYPIDTYATDISYYPDIKEAYEKALINSFNSKSASDISANIKKLDSQINDVIKTKKK